MTGGEGGEGVTSASFNLEALPLGTGEISLEGARISRLDEDVATVDVQSLAQARELAYQLGHKIATLADDALAALAEYGDGLVTDWRLDGGQSSYTEERDRSDPTRLYVQLIYRYDTRNWGFSKMATALRELEPQFGQTEPKES